MGKGFRHLLRPVARLVPCRQAEAVTADTIARALYASPQLLKFIALERPSFAATLLKRSLPQRFEFSDELLDLLLQSPSSLLYDELRDNQNLNRNDGYVIPERNVLLRAYLADARVADELGVYWSVGEHVLRLHGPAMTQQYRDVR